MNMSLELKKKEMELKRVLHAKDEHELRIAECEDQIERLRQQIEIQDQAAEKIKLEIQKLK